MRTRVTAVVLVFILAACTTDRTRRGYLRENAARFTEPPARPVIVVPGFGVSRLYDPVTERFVWGTAHAMVQRRYADDLELDAHDRLVPRDFVGSRGPVNIAWQLTEALRKYGGYTRDRDLYAFAYDWRRSSAYNARELAKLVDDVRSRNGGAKVDIITHSAGALVGLAYVKMLARNDVEHLILIAPPQRGVADAFRLLVRGEHFLRRSFTPAMAATWPSVYELLPEDFLIDERGNAVSSPAPTRDQWRETPMPNDVQLTIIAGDCVPTTRRVLKRDDGTYAFYLDELRENERALASTMFEPGDGTVPISSATNGANAMLFCDGHQGIASDPNVHRALIRILRSATLSR